MSALSATQGRHHDPVSGEQPGRIVHETRHGELAHFRQVPYGRYYGAVDSTPLFLVLLQAHHETTGDPTLALRLQQHARRAVDWILTDGGLGRHGYLVYQPDPDGLVNQNWKDSAGAICFADGTQAQGPIAVSEAQGYAYDALIRTARLAEWVWQDGPYADRLRKTAEALRGRFTTDFWMPRADFPALALDGDGRQVDALASDAGHLLWSGILDADLARRVGQRLLRPDLFSGWAIRTLAAGQRPFHALSYHRGSLAARQRGHHAGPGPLWTHPGGPHGHRRTRRGSRPPPAPPARSIRRLRPHRHGPAGPLPPFMLAPSVGSGHTPRPQDGTGPDTDWAVEEDATGPGPTVTGRPPRDRPSRSGTTFPAPHRVDGVVGEDGQGDMRVPVGTATDPYSSRPPSFLAAWERDPPRGRTGRAGCGGPSSRRREASSTTWSMRRSRP